MLHTGDSYSGCGGSHSGNGVVTIASTECWEQLCSATNIKSNHTASRGLLCVRPLSYFIIIPCGRY